MYMSFKYRLNTDSPNYRESPIPSLLSLLLELLGKRAEQLLQPITVEVECMSIYMSCMYYNTCMHVCMYVHVFK